MIILFIVRNRFLTIEEETDFLCLTWTNVLMYTFVYNELLLGFYCVSVSTYTISIIHTGRKPNHKHI